MRDLGLLLLHRDRSWGGHQCSTCLDFLSRRTTLSGSLEFGDLGYLLFFQANPSPKQFSLFFLQFSTQANHHHHHHLIFIKGLWTRHYFKGFIGFNSFNNPSNSEISLLLLLLFIFLQMKKQGA